MFEKFKFYKSWLSSTFMYFDFLSFGLIFNTVLCFHIKIYKLCVIKTTYFDNIRGKTALLSKTKSITTWLL